MSGTASNRPASITQGTNTTNFQYDVDDRRVMQVVPDGRRDVKFRPTVLSRQESEIVYTYEPSMMDVEKLQGIQLMFPGIHE